jgi:hypothetical protein
MQQGYAAGAQQRQDREQRNRLAEIQGLAPRVISGDLEATNRAFALDPRAAQNFQAEGTRQRQQLRGLAKSLKQAEVNPQLQSALYRQAVPYLRAQFGAEIPEAFDAASVMPVVDQVLAATSDLDAGGEQFTLSPGSKRFDASGKVLAEVPFAPANMQIVDVPDGQGGKIQMLFDPRASSFAQPQYGGSPTRVPSPGVGTVDPAADYRQLGGMPGVRTSSLYRDPENNRRVGGVSNSQHMAGTAGDFVVPAAQKAGFIARARQMGYEAIDEGDHVHVELPRGVQASSRFGGSEPAGAPRLGYQPDISPIEAERLRLAQSAEARAQRAEQRQVDANAVTGKPPTEGERKAATLLQRLTSSQQQLEQAVKEDRSAQSPNLASEVVRSLPLVGGAAANAITPEARQRVEAAQLDILDAALTLGTGAAYTREQLEGYRRSYFPQIGDSQGTIDDKAARLQNVIQAARIAAGRASPDNQDRQQQGQPVRIQSADDYNRLPSGALFIAPDGTQRRKR